MGAMQRPPTVRAATSEAKLVAQAAQKLVAMRPAVVSRYTGRLPTLTASVLKTRLPPAMAAIMAPLQPSVKRSSGTSNSAASGTKADVRRGPRAGPAACQFQVRSPSIAACFRGGKGNTAGERGREGEGTHRPRSRTPRQWRR